MINKRIVCVCVRERERESGDDTGKVLFGTQGWINLPSKALKSIFP